MQIGPIFQDNAGHSCRFGVHFKRTVSDAYLENAKILHDDLEEDWNAQHHGDPSFFRCTHDFDDDEFYSILSKKIN